MDKIKVCIVGALGRMGREVIKAVHNDPSTSLYGAVDALGNGFIGFSAAMLAGIADASDDCDISDDLATVAAGADVIIDFTGAKGTHANISIYKKLKKPIIIGSTGLTDAQLADIKELSHDMPLIWASNMSVGVNVAVKLVEIAASVLGSDYDIEVFEAHHKHKKDAPSGTALTLAKAAAEGRKIDFNASAVYARQGITGERVDGTIGFQVLRGGDIAGEHSVIFCGNGERLEITHRASSPAIFADGAVKAAKWIYKKPSGLYSINDVLELK